MILFIINGKYRVEYISSCTVTDVKQRRARLDGWPMWPSVCSPMYSSPNRAEYKQSIFYSILIHIHEHPLIMFQMIIPVQSNILAIRVLDSLKQAINMCKFPSIFFSLLSSRTFNSVCTYISDIYLYLNHPVVCGVYEPGTGGLWPSHLTANMRYYNSADTYI